MFEKNRKSWGMEKVEVANWERQKDLSFSSNNAPHPELKANHCGGSLTALRKVPPRKGKSLRVRIEERVT